MTYVPSKKAVEAKIRMHVGNKVTNSVDAMKKKCGMDQTESHFVAHRLSSSRGKHARQLPKLIEHQHGHSDSHQQMAHAKVNPSCLCLSGLKRMLCGWMTSETEEAEVSRHYERAVSHVSSQPGIGRAVSSQPGIGRTQSITSRT